MSTVLRVLFFLVRMVIFPIKITRFKMDALDLTTLTDAARARILENRGKDLCFIQITYYLDTYHALKQFSTQKSRYLHWMQLT